MKQKAREVYESCAGRPCMKAWRMLVYFLIIEQLCQTSDGICPVPKSQGS